MSQYAPNNEASPDVPSGVGRSLSWSPPCQLGFLMWESSQCLLGSEQGPGICLTKVPLKWMIQRTFKHGKEREEPQEHERLQVEHGVDGVLQACGAERRAPSSRACAASTWPVLGPSPGRRHVLTELGLLQQHLREGPANAADERGAQHQGEALHVELCGLVGEHEEAPSDEQDHQDQGCALGSREQLS